MINPVHYFFDNSIKRSVMASFVIVLLLPIGFFIYSLFVNSWETAQQTMLEKHELISSAMVEPLTLFISSRQQSLQSLGEEILTIEQEINAKNNTHEKYMGPHKIQEALEKHQKSYADLIAISYASNTGHSHHHISAKKQYITPQEIPNYSKTPLTMLAPIDKSNASIDLLSTTFRSSISNKPIILLKHYVLDEEGNIKNTLISEISPKYVTDMCSKINFGDKGHCAIVDQAGRVIAHPNKKWIKEIKDLSKLSIIKKMLDGKSGTTEFYSPFLKADMVAGFSAIPKLGWGIMIPQPKTELTKTLGSLRKSTIIWMSLGIIIALTIAYLLTNKITKPIRILTKRTHEISAGYDFIRLGTLPKNSPREINQLWLSISRLLTSLQTSNREVKKLNISLNRDIHKATKKLRSMNKHLYEISNKDYLTTLANRRYFTSYLEKILTQKKDEFVGIILIDIDKFKFINDEYGHEAGDLALKHVSIALQKFTRKCDLVSRLGGDEFVVYIKNTSDKSLAKIAEKFRSTIEKDPILFKSRSIDLTLSIGTVNHICDKSLTLEDYLRFADKAMYLSKQSGRNKVSGYKFSQQTT